MLKYLKKIQTSFYFILYFNKHLYNVDILLYNHNAIIMTNEYLLLHIIY